MLVFWVRDGRANPLKCPVLCFAGGETEHIALDGAFCKNNEGFSFCPSGWELTLCAGQRMMPQRWRNRFAFSSAFAGIYKQCLNGRAELTPALHVSPLVSCCAGRMLADLAAEKGIMRCVFVVHKEDDSYRSLGSVRGRWASGVQPGSLLERVVSHAAALKPNQRNRWWLDSLGYIISFGFNVRPPWAPSSANFQSGS